MPFAFSEDQDSSETFDGSGVMVDELKIQRMLNAGRDLEEKLEPLDLDTEDDSPREASGEAWLIRPGWPELDELVAAAHAARTVDELPRRITPAECASWIDDFIADYRRRNPDYNPPDRSDHPAVIMVGLSSEATKELGDPVAFWMIVIHAMQEWFSPREDSLAYRVIDGVFAGQCGLAEDTGYGHGMGMVYQIQRRWRSQGN